jgi:hypothetical protein
MVREDRLLAVATNHDVVNCAGILLLQFARLSVGGFSGKPPNVDPSAMRVLVMV